MENNKTLAEVLKAFIDCLKEKGLPVRLEPTDTVGWRIFWEPMRDFHTRIHLEHLESMPPIAPVTQEEFMALSSTLRVQSARLHVYHDKEEGDMLAASGTISLEFTSGGQQCVLTWTYNVWTPLERLRLLVEQVDEALALPEFKSLVPIAVLLKGMLPRLGVKVTP